MNRELIKLKYKIFLTRLEIEFVTIKLFLASIFC